MPTQTERIQLELISSYNARGLETALDLYEQVYAAHNKLAARLKTPLDFNVRGMDAAARKVQQLSAQSKTKVEAFHDALISLGDPQTAAKIATGQTTIDKVLSKGGDTLTRLKRKADETRDAFERQQRFFTKTDFSRLAPTPDAAAKLTRDARAKMEALEMEAEASKKAYREQKRMQAGLRDAALYTPKNIPVTSTGAKMAAAEERLAGKAEGGEKIVRNRREQAKATEEAAQKMGLLETKTREGVLETEKFAAGLGKTQLVKYKDGLGETVETTDKLAATTARLADRENAYRTATAQAGKDLAARATLNRENVRWLVAQAKALKDAGYGHTEEATRINRLIATRLAERTAIRQSTGALETHRERAQEALQTQITTQERLNRVRSVAGRYDRLQSGAEQPSEKAAILERRAAALRREAEQMRALGIEEKEVRRVRAAANAADNQALKLRTGLSSQTERAQGNLQKQVYLEEKLAEVAQVRGRFQAALADKSIDPATRVGLLNQQSQALRRQAEELRAMGASEAKILAMEREALKLRAKARTVESNEGIRQTKATERVGAASGATFNPAGYTQGDRTTRTRAGAQGRLREETEEWSKLTGKIQENVRVTRTYDSAGKNIETTIRRTNSELRDLGRTGDFSSRSFIHNTAVVATWAASVAAYQGVVAVLRNGAVATAELERSTAILLAVFQHGKDEAYALRDGVIALASAQGRSADEAVDAATRFARMGLTRVQVMEAVRVSLMAANVAEISAAESSEYLASIMVAFGLKVQDLKIVLGELNTISNTYNATNKDMLEGIARVGNLAKQAKLPLEELMGMIATGVGRTGRPGAEFGNAIKAMIVSLSTPGIQDKLKMRFGFEVKNDMGEIKDFSAILSELYVKYQQLGGAEKQELLQRVGQKQQASRLAAILDGYVNTQVLAIRAQRDLNSAEEENKKIRATMISQLQSVNTEFQRAAVNMVASGESPGVTSVIQSVLKLMTNLLSLVSAFPQVSAVLIALLVAMAIRVARLAMAMGQAGAKGNYFANTCKQITVALNSMSVAVNRANRTMAAGTGPLGGFARGMRGISVSILRLTRGIAIIGGIGRALVGLVRFATFAVGTITSLLGGLLAFAAVEAVIWGVNKAFDFFAGKAVQAEKEIAKLNATAEEFGRKASASQQAVRLFDTVGKAAAQPQFSEEQARLAAEGVAEVAYPKDPLRQRQLKEELTLLFKQKDILAIQARMEQLKADGATRAAGERSLELQANQKLIAIQEKELALIRAKIAAKDRASKPAEKEREKEKELSESIQRARDKQLEGVGYVETGEEENAREKVAEAYSTGRMGAIERFAGKLPQPYTETQSVQSEIKTLQAKLLLLNKTNEAINANAAAAKKAAEEAAKPLKEAREHFGQEKQANDARRKRVDEMRKMYDALGWKEGAPGLINPRPMPAEVKALRDQAVKEGWTKGQLPDGSYERDFLRREGQEVKDTITRKPGEENTIIDNLDRQIAAQNTIAAAMQEQIAINEKLSAQERAKIDLQIKQAEAGLRTARATDEAQKASTAAKAEQSRYMIGRTESEKIIRQSDELMNKSIPAQQAKLLGNQWAIAAPNTKNKDEYRLDSINQEVQLQEHILRLQQNKDSLLLRQKEIEADIANEKQRQVQEASKALLLASREEQLQAALIARYAQKRGGQGFSADDFQFLSQGTRQNIEKYTPNLAPPELNTSLQELQRESAVLNANFTRLSQAIADTVARFEGLNPQATAAAYGAQKPPEVLPPVPQLNVAMGGVNVEMSAQFAALIDSFRVTAINGMREYVDPQFIEMRNMILHLSMPRPATNATARQ